MKNIDEVFMRIATIFAEQSTCVKRKVGAVLVKDARIISTGYNGTPSGFQNCNQVFDGDLKKGRLHLSNGEYLVISQISHHDFSERYEIHAEQNCLMMAAKNGISTNNCTIYITTAPCSQCAKLIVSSGIKRVVYHELYKENYGLKLLELCGVKADKI